MTATYPLLRPSAFAANATNPLATLDSDLVNLTDTLNSLGNGASTLSTVAITTATITNANITTALLTTANVVTMSSSNVVITGGTAILSTANIVTITSTTSSLGNISAASANIGSLNISTAVLSGLANNSALIIQNNSSVGAVLPGAIGNILTSNGTVWTSQAGAASALTSKIIQIGRDPSSADGNVSYTGVGFQPSSLCSSWVQGTENVGHGFSDSTKTSFCNWLNSSVNNFAGAGFIALGTGADNPTSTRDVATISSYDANGFTLMWTKSGSPTSANITINVACYK